MDIDAGIDADIDAEWKQGNTAEAPYDTWDEGGAESKDPAAEDQMTQTGVRQVGRNLPKRRSQYHITATDRDGIIAQFMERLPVLVRAMRLSAEGQTPEDFLSESYVAMIEAVDAFDPDEARRTGVTIEQHVIRRVRCRLIDKQRYHSAMKRSCGTVVEDSTADPFTVEGVKIGDIALNMALQDLGKMERTILEWYYKGDLSERQIAEQLGVSEHRIHYRRKRALKALKALLEG